MKTLMKTINQEHLNKAIGLAIEIRNRQMAACGEIAMRVYQRHAEVFHRDTMAEVGNIIANSQRRYNEYGQRVDQLLALL